MWKNCAGFSCSYFKNPLFVHDSQLQLISCPVWREGMIVWEKDEQTGQLITPLEDLNDFRTDREYLHTLTTEGAHIYSAELRGYRDIYVNIRDDNGTYEGRLVICEIDTPLKPRSVCLCGISGKADPDGIVQTGTSGYPVQACPVSDAGEHGSGENLYKFRD